MQSSVASASKNAGEQGVRGEVDEELVGLFDALADEDCRRILHALQIEGDALNARELSDECGLPLSTIYRKLRVLGDAGLVRESTELRSRGKHTSSYEPGFDEILVTVSADGVGAHVSPRK